MKQTAVEWMFEQFFKVKWDSMKGNMPTIFEQAKEMEKEQIIQAHDKQLKKTQTAGNYEYWKTGEQYYNETFNTKEKCLSCNCEKQDYVLYCEFCRQQI